MGNKSHSKTSLWLIQSKAHLRSPCRKVSVVVFGPPRGCFHAENWASCPCHTLAIGEHALAMVIRHILHLQKYRFPRLFKTPPPVLMAPPFSSTKLWQHNSSPGWKHRMREQGWGGDGSASLWWCLLSSHQRNEASRMFSKVWKNFQIIA